MWFTVREYLTTLTLIGAISMIIYSIYKIVNQINGKIYIGFDSKWPNRKNSHKYHSKNRNQHIYLAFRKYGWENFEWSIIEQSDKHETLLKEKEEYYIRFYNTFYDNGYNMTYGGDGTFGWIPSEETKKKISKSRKGIVPWNKGKPSPWTSKRNRESKGIKKPSRERWYLITDPLGNEYKIKGLVEKTFIEKFTCMANSCSL